MKALKGEKKPARAHRATILRIWPVLKTVYGVGGGVHCCDVDELFDSSSGTDSALVASAMMLCICLPNVCNTHSSMVESCKIVIKAGYANTSMCLLVGIYARPPWRRPPKRVRKGVFSC